MVSFKFIQALLFEKICGQVSTTKKAQKKIMHEGLSYETPTSGLTGTKGQMGSHLVHGI